MLSFDVETHAYTWHGRRLPSVTWTLRETGHLDDLTWFGSAAALVRGRTVHALTALMDATAWADPGRVVRLPKGYRAAPRSLVVQGADGGLCAACPPAFAGYFRAYAAFRSTYAGRWTFIETAVARPDLGYAGTPDRIGVLAGRPAVLEIKTGAAAAWHGIQMAAYDLLDPLPFERDRAAVYLQADGTFRIRRYADAEDRMRFLRALGQVQAQTHTRTGENR